MRCSPQRRRAHARAGGPSHRRASALQERAGSCRDVTFPHFLARPYVLGLQDMLFRCGDAVHDFYHVEPQAACLLDAAGDFAVDWLVRCAPACSERPLSRSLGPCAVERGACTFEPRTAGCSRGSVWRGLTGRACRAERLQEDMAGLVAMLNTRRAPGLPELENNVGWAQKGPLAKSGGGGAEPHGKRSRHLDKFAKCGRRCFDLARLYYAEDLARLGYSQTSADLP